ncbi:hypothetical protein FGIG_12134 [Fasciola gigantica]|uniref:Uncharacterized protein n=1 Tax=Fasciola gigantica TaxID=46835 RepID=A0A504YKG5_FASGI|nr:hypothetical protein FGIG_12134 [Fasciola gigantica]
MGLGMLIFGDQDIPFGSVEGDDHTLHHKSQQTTQQIQQEQSALQTGLSGPHGKSLMADTPKDGDRFQEIQPVNLPGQTALLLNQMYSSLKAVDRARLEEILTTHGRASVWGSAPLGRTGVLQYSVDT